MGEFRFIAGLGNPGPEYEGTRHNIGFLLLDALLDAGGSSTWREKNGAQVAEIQFEGGRVTLIKPLEYMNLSGPPVARVMQFVKAEPSELIVAHDDIDLPFGTMRIREEGGDGGHRGIQSLVSALGTGRFVRLKLGVGRPENGEVADWVLERFSKQDTESLPQYLGRGIEALRSLFVNGVKVTQNKFNVRVKADLKDSPK